LHGKGAPYTGAASCAEQFCAVAGSLFVGSYVLEFFGITLPIVRVAGGLVVAATGWNLLKGGYQANNPRDGHEPVVPTDGFYPLTMPITVAQDRSRWRSR